MNNGTTKGCDPEVFATLTSTPSIKDVFQLHKNLRPDGDVNNVEATFIANLEKTCDGNLIHMAVSQDGKQYVVSIPATKFERTYATKRLGNSRWLPRATWGRLLESNQSPVAP